MFDEFDNFYPKKPTLITKSGRNNLSKYFLVAAIFLILFNSIESSNYWLVISMVLVISIHELGHFISMKYFGYNETNFMFHSLIANSNLNNAKFISQKSKIFTLQMGPVPGIIFGSFLFYYATSTTSESLVVLSLVLIFINLFSLLPLDPLDGGKIIKVLFFPKAQKPYLFFVLISSLLVIIIGYLTGFYMLMVLGFLMGFKVRGIQKNMLIYDELEIQDLNYFKPYNLLTDKEYWKIRSVFLDFNPKIKNLIPSSYEVWENEPLLTTQITQLLKTDIKLDAGFGLKIFSFFIYISCLIVPLYLLQINFEFIEEILSKISMNV